MFGKNRAIWCRLAFWLFVVAFGWGVMRTALASELDRSSERCMRCHQDGAGAHIHDWQHSAHARFGMVCSNCHAEALPEVPSGGENGRTACVRPA